MKTFLLLLLFAVSASAQTRKWSATIPLDQSVYYQQLSSDPHPFPDGGGGCVLFLELRLRSTNEHAGMKIIWVSPVGKIAYHGIGNHIEVIRVTKRALILRTGEVAIGDPPLSVRTQLVRITKHKGVLVERVSNIEEPIAEAGQFTREPLPKDPLGFFRVVAAEDSITVTRYLDN